MCIFMFYRVLHFFSKFQRVTYGLISAVYLNSSAKNEGRELEFLDCVFAVHFFLQDFRGAVYRSPIRNELQ